jgi:hypothetical protein
MACGQDRGFRVSEEPGLRLAERYGLISVKMSLKLIIGQAPPAGFEAKNFVPLLGALIQSSAAARPRVHMS